MILDSRRLRLDGRSWKSSRQKDSGRPKRLLNNRMQTLHRREDVCVI